MISEEATVTDEGRIPLARNIVYDGYAMIDKSVWSLKSTPTTPADFQTHCAIADQYGE